MNSNVNVSTDDYVVIVNIFCTVVIWLWVTMRASYFPPQYFYVRYLSLFSSLTNYRSKLSMKVKSSTCAAQAAPHRPDCCKSSLPDLRRPCPLI